MQAQDRRGLQIPKGLHPLCGISGSVCKLAGEREEFLDTWGAPSQPEVAQRESSRAWWGKTGLLPESNAAAFLSFLLTHTPSSASSSIFLLSPSRPCLSPLIPQLPHLGGEFSGRRWRVPGLRWGKGPPAQWEGPRPRWGRGRQGLKENSGVPRNEGGVRGAQTGGGVS